MKAKVLGVLVGAGVMWTLAGVAREPLAVAARSSETSYASSPELLALAATASDDRQQVMQARHAVVAAPRRMQAGRRREQAVRCPHGRHDLQRRVLWRLVFDGAAAQRVPGRPVECTAAHGVR